jgi:hypothetical protein
MKQLWFKRVRWIYIPIHPLGTIGAIIFIVPVVIAVDSNAHSITDELYQSFIHTRRTAF